MNTNAMLLHEYASRCYEYARSCGEDCPWYTNARQRFADRARLYLLERLLENAGLIRYITRVRHFALRVARKDDNTVPLVL